MGYPLIVFMATLALASLVYRYIEKPFMEAGRAKEPLNPPN